ncbi:MAG: RrF2 family transcriptional regulator [Phycisphaerae bacterium]
MLSVTSEYAIRAMVYITQQGDEEPVLARTIASELEIPANYVSKILRDMAHGGLLKSSRGVGGGFRLARDARRIRLGDIVTPFENVPHNARCPFGNAVCSDEHPCAAHDYWRDVKAAYDDFLEHTTLAMVARERAPRAAPKRKRRLPADRQRRAR